MTHEVPSQSFRIGTRRVDARVELSNGASLTGQFTCAVQAHHHVGSETLGDLLNERARFVPFFPAERPEPVLLNKRLIRVVEVTTIEPTPPVEALAEERGVVLLLDDGRELRGRVHVAAPEGHTRTLDHLNEAGRFLALRVPTGTLLVNVRAVALAEDDLL